MSTLASQKRRNRQRSDEEYQAMLNAFRLPVECPPCHISPARITKRDWLTGRTIVTIDPDYEFSWEEWQEKSIEVMEHCKIDELDVDSRREIWENDVSFKGVKQ